jgi:hypothetical protein
MALAGNAAGAGNLAGGAGVTIYVNATVANGMDVEEMAQRLADVIRRRSR